MKWPKLIKFIDYFILFCLCVLVIFLPIAHTESIRAFSLGIPAGLWIIKAILCRRFLFVRTPVDLPILLFTLVAGLSVVTAVDPRYSLQEFIGEWIIGICLFYLVVNNVQSEQVKYILGALLLGNIIMVTYGIFDFFRDGGQVLNYATRAGSLHSGVGTFSTYLVTVIPYILVALFYEEKMSNRLAILALFSLNCLALVLTYSRGSWITVGILLFVMGCIFLPKRIFIPSFAVLVVGISFLFSQEISSYYQRFIPSPNHMPDSYQSRWALTKFSAEKILENPLQMNGFGHGTFVKKFRHEEFWLGYKGAGMWHAHNTFLNLAIQTGLQGLFLFCFLLYRMLKYCREREKSGGSPVIRYFSLATFMMIVAFFFRNLSDDFFIDDSALLFWFLSGIVFASGNGELDKKHGVRRK
jgi:O-antigen ligase